jgi:hypothetical protein
MRRVTLGFSLFFLFILGSTLARVKPQVALLSEENNKWAA